MSDLITVQGMVIHSLPVGEYDKRIVLLTRERGKIPAFAKGARRPNSPVMAAADPFVFGSFTLYEGRSSYTLKEASVTHHFAELASRQPGVYYGYYFLEIADYFGREGIDCTEELNLLYVTVKALLNPAIDDRLVRCIFELRMLVIQGLMPQLNGCVLCGTEMEDPGAAWFSFEHHGILDPGCAGKVPDAKGISGQVLYAMRWIAASPLGKLYTFSLGEETLRELEYYVLNYTRRNTDRRFRSLEILEIMTKTL